MVTVYKGKGDGQIIHRGIKLLDHALKVFEGLLRSVREQKLSFILIRHSDSPNLLFPG